MGCGKSSVGRELSKLLCCPFMDLDAVIEERCGCTVAEIFAASGEGEFRRLEKDTLKDILETEGRGLTPACKNQEHPSNERPQMILALGGGAVMTPECERMVHEQTVCVYLRTSVDELVARLSDEAAGRPLLGTQPGTEDNALRKEDLYKRIMDLMAQRCQTYEKTAHIIIDTDGKTVDAVSEEIVKSISSIF